MYAPTLGIHWNSPENITAEFISQDYNIYLSVIDLQVLQWWSHREALYLGLQKWILIGNKTANFENNVLRNSS